MSSSEQNSNDANITSTSASATAKTDTQHTTPATTVTTPAHNNTNNALSNTKQDEVLKLLKQLGLNRQLSNATDKHEYKFWSTQPVQQFDATQQKTTADTVEQGAIEQKQVDQVMSQPYPLPTGFYWICIDMSNPTEATEVYDLLCANYVEDDDNMFRFDYSREFLQWALRPPGYNKDWHIGVRHSQTNKLYAFISGVPAHIAVYDSVKQMVEINFLCVHKKLRSKRLAPVLIKEVTRRVNLCNIWQAVYTAGVVLPKPVAVNRYYHRSLNPQKLIEIGFSRLQPNMTMSRTIKLYKLPNTTQIPGIRPLEQRDCKAACKLLNEYLKQFKLVQQFDETEFEHWFMPRTGVISCYVVENFETHEITDLTSWYTLPSTVIGNDKHKSLKAAYSFYHVNTSVELHQLVNDALILAVADGFDVFNALNLMQNDKFIQPLKFGMGDGELHYYLFNWKCPQMKPDQVGLVLL